MPDHLHLFVAPEDDASPPIGKWVAYWKRLVSRHLGMTALWQKDCWDTQMRHRRAYEEKWEYVRHNPVRHGLVREAKDWPYQGSLHPLEW
jgi:putative transposase